ncbi:hypothetical protein [Streptodolium elevatio]|uniref:DUF2771 domain-containing protein n=1 Tax=Streptodolium elevatio TaxID=3157996 RepID=A0ABV3DGW5_9ACTN
MMIRRHAAVAGAVVLGAFALTGCEKPTPIVTLVNGSDSVAIEESCSKSDLADEAKTRECSKDSKVLKVTTGTTLRVGVDKELADSGWKLQIGERESDVIKDKTFQNMYTVPEDAFEDEKQIQVAVVKVNKAGDSVGAWTFVLEKK